MAWIASSVLCFLLVITTATSSAVAPRHFRNGDALELKVNKLFSSKSLLRYDYYSLSYCRPPAITNSAHNLGEFLRGDRTSFFTFHMREEQACKMACRIVLNAKAAKDFKQKIDEEYRVNMILDDLPVVVRGQNADGSPSEDYEKGFRVGFKGRFVESEEYLYYIYNHLSFTVMYHRDEETSSARIVGFEVAPYSIKHKNVEWDWNHRNVFTCNKSIRYTSKEGAVSLQRVGPSEDITFSYDISFKETDIEWASRWDAYQLINDDQIHWFSVLNSLLIILFLCGTVATIMIRTLDRDIASYNGLESGDEAHEETGWQLLHGDVFRLPLNQEALCLCAGSGVQMLGTTLVTMIFPLLGFLSPPNRGGLMTTMVLLWLLMSFLGGYSSARLSRMFGATEWKRSALKTALLFPGILLSVFFALTSLIRGEMPSWGIPFGTVLALSILWLGASAPLVFLGGYFGFKKAAIEAPVESYKIPREIPKQPWYLMPIFSVLMGGILPFVSVIIEFPVIFWMNRLFDVFGFLLVAFVVLMIVCAEIAVVFCYLQLCSEDYNWWWRAFMNAGSSAFFLFVYSIFYLVMELESTMVASGILYMFIVMCAFFVVTGAVGFYACFWFVRTIYSAVFVETVKSCPTYEI